MSHLWIVQKTELTKKPKFTSSRKNAYFEKRLKKLPRKEDVLPFKTHRQQSNYLKTNKCTDIALRN